MVIPYKLQFPQGNDVTQGGYCIVIKKRDFPNCCQSLVLGMTEKEQGGRSRLVSTVIFHYHYQQPFYLKSGKEHPPWRFAQFRLDHQSNCSVFPYLIADCQRAYQPCINTRNTCHSACCHYHSKVATPITCIPATHQTESLIFRQSLPLCNPQDLKATMRHRANDPSTRSVMSEIQFNGNICSF